MRRQRSPRPAVVDDAIDDLESIASDAILAGQTFRPCNGSNKLLTIACSTDATAPWRQQRRARLRRGSQVTVSLPSPPCQRPPGLAPSGPGQIEVAHEQAAWELAAGGRSQASSG